MKQIRINYKQISRTTGEILREGKFTYRTLESALKSMLEFHNDTNEYESTYIEFEPFIEEEI